MTVDIPTEANGLALDTLAERQEKHLRLCPNGCGCRYMTNDPDRRDCACDGPCCMNDWWDGLEDAEAVLLAAAPLIAERAIERATAGERYWNREGNPAASPGRAATGQEA